VTGRRGTGNVATCGGQVEKDGGKRWEECDFLAVWDAVSLFDGGGGKVGWRNGGFANATKSNW